jgi:transcriptional regulator with XRE-family HTH domain
LTQAALATRLGTTQSAIARLERNGANPSFATLRRALSATGHGLELNARRSGGKTPVSDRSGIDETLIHRNLKLTPAQRLAAFQVAYDQVREIARAGAAARGELA